VSGTGTANIEMPASSPSSFASSGTASPMTARGVAARPTSGFQQRRVQCGDIAESTITMPHRAPESHAVVTPL